MWLQRRGRPAAMELGLALVGLLVGWLVAGLVGGGLLHLLPPGPGQTSAGMLLGPLVTCTAAVVYWQLGSRLSRGGPQDPHAEDPGPRPPASVARTSAFIGLGLLATLAGSMVIGLVMDLLGHTVEEQAAVVKIVQDALSGGPWLPAVALSVSATLLAPLAEEWLFRGLLYRRIRVAAGPGLAYGCSALAFAAIHNNPTGLLVYAWLGLVFAVTYQRTGRLAAAMAVHLGNNAFVLATLFLATDV